MPVPRLMRPAAAAAVALALLAATGCSDDDSSSASTSAATTTEGTGTAVSDAAPADLEVWQTDLKVVGCYGGEIDGDLGPQTEAAIRAFQTETGLTVDGQLGPQTEAALQKAVDAGTKVCASPATVTTTTTATTTASGGAPATAGQASLASAGYGKTFGITSCSLNADVSNISLRGAADGLTLTVDASQGTGTLGVSGGTESDGITLQGTVTGVQITPARSFTVRGEFTGENNTGEAFTLTGSCPE